MQPAPRNQPRIIKAAGALAPAVAMHCATREWADGASVLKRDAGSWVLAGGSPAGPVVVKSMPADRPADALKMLFGRTRLLRQWQGAEVLARLRIPAARPIALWRSKDPQGRIIESLATEWLQGETVLHRVASPSASLDTLARDVGRLTGRLAGLGWFNRDHKPSNLMVLEGGGIALLDTVAIRRAAPRAALTRMLFTLLVEPIGCAVRVPARLRAVVMLAACRELGFSGEDRRVLRRRIEQRLSRHGDPRPKVNPLD